MTSERYSQLKPGDMVEILDLKLHSTGAYCEVQKSPSFSGMIRLRRIADGKIVCLSNPVRVEMAQAEIEDGGMVSLHAIYCDCERCKNRASS